MSKRFTKSVATLAIIAAFASAMPTQAASMQPTARQQTTTVTLVSVPAKASYSPISFGARAAPQAVVAPSAPKAFFDIIKKFVKKVVKAVKSVWDTAVSIVSHPFIKPVVTIGRKLLCGFLGICF